MTNKKPSLEERAAIAAFAEMPKPLDQLSETEIERKSNTCKVMTHTLECLTRSFLNSGFEWLLPVVFSRTTDPLWPDPGASIEKRIEVEVYGTMIRPTASMIVHKMVASSLTCPKLFTLSPNVRIEKTDRSFTGIHAYEFTQFDFEARDATSKDIMSLVEDVTSELVVTLKKEMKEELVYLARSRSLDVPRVPFKVYNRKELEDEFGRDWESELVAEATEPVWVTNIPREFYDFENPETGEWDNYNLLLPKYGEVLSGSRREHDYFRILGKMEKENVRKENYEVLLKLAKNGVLKPSARSGHRNRETRELDHRS